jgi:FKBP-type peptidyl-prolyl cis-trans isomerase SlyD
LKVRVAPEDAYGLSREDRIQVVPKDRFQGMEGEIEVGMQFHARTSDGIISVRVSKVENDEVTIDGNHPLADQFLNFEVKVADVRLASEEEMDHGHPHREGGCCGGHEHGEGGCCGGHDDDEDCEEGGCCGGGHGEGHGHGGCGCNH